MTGSQTTVCGVFHDLKNVKKTEKFQVLWI
jgi:hypothetical protein